MRYTLIIFIFILFFSCNKQDSIKNENFVSFLENFENVDQDFVRNYDFLEFGNNTKIDDNLVLEFLCLNKNLCFYSNSYLKNEYYYLFKCNYLDELVLIFYRKLEPPLDSKAYASLVDVNQKKVISTIMISGLSQENYKAEVEISNDLKFRVKRSFYKSDFSELSNSKTTGETLIETYFIDREGVFTLE